MTDPISSMSKVEGQASAASGPPWSQKDQRICSCTCDSFVAHLGTVLLARSVMAFRQEIKDFPKHLRQTCQIFYQRIKIRFSLPYVWTLQRRLPRVECLRIFCVSIMFFCSFRQLCLQYFDHLIFAARRLTVASHQPAIKFLSGMFGNLLQADQSLMSAQTKVLLFFTTSSLTPVPHHFAATCPHTNHQSPQELH